METNECKHFLLGFSIFKWIKQTFSVLFRGFKVWWTARTKICRNKTWNKKKQFLWIFGLWMEKQMQASMRCKDRYHLSQELKLLYQMLQAEIQATQLDGLRFKNSDWTGRTDGYGAARRTRWRGRWPIWFLKQKRVIFMSFYESKWWTERKLNDKWRTEANMTFYGFLYWMENLELYDAKWNKIREG